MWKTIQYDEIKAGMVIRVLNFKTDKIFFVLSNLERTPQMKNSKIYKIIFDDRVRRVTLIKTDTLEYLDC